MVAEDSLLLSAPPRLLPFPSVALDSVHAWLVYRSDSSGGAVSSFPREPFSPPPPARTWAEKQYLPLPPPPSQVPTQWVHGLLFLFLVAATLLAILLRLYFTRYYKDYIKVLFHPRSVFRLREVEGPHLLQFHVLTDAVVLLSLGAILFAGIRSFFPEVASSPWSFPAFFALFVAYYAYRFALLYGASHLIVQPLAGVNLWRQYAYVHRLLWPLYLFVAYWALFASSPLAQFFSYVGLGLYAVTTLYAWVRVLLTFVYCHYNLFYYFLYLCVLEIAPILAIFRWWTS